MILFPDHPALNFHVLDNQSRTYNLLIVGVNHTPAHQQQIEIITGTGVIMIGGIEKQMIAFMDSQTNESLRETLGMSPTVTTKIRTYLGIRRATGRGGKRPNSGNKIGWNKSAE